VADDDVENLWELIQAIATKPFADAGDAWIVRDFGHSLAHV
jgi:hypothetical protein